MEKSLDNQFSPKEVEKTFSKNKEYFNRQNYYYNNGRIKKSFPKILQTDFSGSESFKSVMENVFHKKGEFNIKTLDPLKYYSDKILKKKNNFFMTEENSTNEGQFLKKKESIQNSTSDAFDNKSAGPKSKLCKKDSIQKTILSFRDTINSNINNRIKCYNMKKSKEIDIKNFFLCELLENNPELNGKVESMRINMKSDENYRKIKQFSFNFPKINYETNNF